jgi:adenylate kinase
MRLIMLGLPGAGKGTQARWLAKALKVPHISTGQIFRDALKSGTPLGLKAKSYTDGGNLVPDEIVIGIVVERLAAADCREQGFILDGFPRTLPQGQALDVWMIKNNVAIDHVIELDVSPETVVVRLSGRRLCVDCGKDYNVHYRLPKIEGRCDYCLGELKRRDDDEPAAIRRRLEVDAAQTRPLHDFYAAKGNLLTFFGEDSIETVFRTILARLDRTWEG